MNDLEKYEERFNRLISYYNSYPEGKDKQDLNTQIRSLLRELEAAKNNELQKDNYNLYNIPDSRASNVSSASNSGDFQSQGSSKAATLVKSTPYSLLATEPENNDYVIFGSQGGKSSVLMLATITLLFETLFIVLGLLIYK